MKFKSFSPKQLKVLTWWCENSPYKDRDAIICDGAVRSGKTVSMSLSFVLWAFYRFDGTDFAICGKTIRNVKRNIVNGLTPMLHSLGFICDYKVSENLLTVSGKGRVNRFYLYGGKDESSAALIQGMTLGGILFDEVALMPRSFVEQALARCSLTGAKFWFNCNPEHPHHWFFTEWISKLTERNALYVHFTMRDNPSLSKETRLRYENMFSGAFYQRFVLGKWVKAEGLIYPFMGDEMYIDTPDFRELEEWAVSVDYGTVNPTSAGLWGRSGDCWYRVDEYYFSSREEGYQKTDEEHLRAIEDLIAGRNISCVVVDPSAASFITLMGKKGFTILKADNNVLNGIRLVGSALKSGRIKICRNCRWSIREFGLYSWNDDVSRDVPIKENDHAMDEIRYFVSTVVENRPVSFAVAAPR